MKRFRKTFGKGNYREVFEMKDFGNGQFSMKLTDYSGGEVSVYESAKDVFNMIGMWAYEMANNSSVGCKVNEWMCEKTGIKFFYD